MLILCQPTTQEEEPRRLLRLRRRRRRRRCQLQGAEEVVRSRLLT
jgi:hypothetical protein